MRIRGPVPWTAVTYLTYLLLLMGQAVPSNHGVAHGVADGAQVTHTTTVGLPARIEQLVLPGSELEPVPLVSDASPVVVRIEQVFPHGTDFRYDLVYYGLEPGTYDLSRFLQRKDGSPTDDLPEVSVEIESVLAAGQVEPNALRMNRSPRLGGYQLALILITAAWVLGLLLILFYKRRSTVTGAGPAAQPRTLAERLRPYVEQAMTGSLSPEKRAQLEMMLLTYWRRRLGLEHLKPAESLQRMKDHPAAGELLQALEQWLHRPVPPESDDVARLLEPYKHVHDSPALTAGNGAPHADESQGPRGGQAG